jgi:alkanesulfonate monooxygenase SsuD/methylene tetrahydromethanopterin reductase-like flavin-dependent oxidoreductase (luciferase family)
MRFGFVLPYGDAQAAGELAAELEQAGWDGLFVWEPVWGYDAWILLAAAAVRTERLRLGTMITPLARMRPWKLASETVTLDHLSNGRVILSVGLGAVDTGWAAFGEPTDRKTRAELLDEGLAILTGLWAGQPFSFEGQHYHIEPLDFLPPPPPVQKPRIPIWVVGAWRHSKSMRRALAYDGLLPNVIGVDGSARTPTVAEVAEITADIRAQRGSQAPYDLVVEGSTPGDDPTAAADQVRPWVQAGATWWIEALWDAVDDPGGPARALQRARQGPPRVD